MTKRELINWVRRQLGYPVVRVELHDSQIEDAIYKAREKFIKWATGDATDEVFFTIALSANVAEYELPSGVTEVITCKDIDSSGGGINTLFSTQNFLYNNGALNFLNNIGQYSILDYHMTLDYLDLIDQYTPDYYVWRYNKSENKIKLSPIPDENSPSDYIIIQSSMLQGTTVDTKVISDTNYNVIYDKGWVKDYTLAQCKVTLGLIRRKFANFNSIGNTGISLDGDSLVSEGQMEMDSLEESVKNSEGAVGWGFICA